jgi:UDPglucose 6-dehydrogenase
MTRICMVGSWHLAQVMAACLAEAGHTVRGVHDDAAAIESLASGRPTVFEPEMEASMQKSLKAGRLSWTTDYDRALAGITMVFVAIDTPIHPEGIDLGPIRKAVRRIAKAVKKPYTLVISSQVPVGESQKLQASARKLGPHCDVVCNPEFLRLGGAMELQRRPDRIVLGGEDAKAMKKVARVYEPFDAPVLEMGLREAEIVKHATNAYVAAQVSFIGEIAQVCDEYGADCMPVSKAMKLDRRIGKYAYILPGLGFNGGTVARDVRLLRGLARAKRRSAPLMQAVLDVNARQNGQIAERLAEGLKRPKGKRVALLGLTYKPKTSTLRHSLTLQIADQMLERGMKLSAYDPDVPPDRKAIIPPDEHNVPRAIEVCASLDEALAGADAVVVMTAKPEFKELQLKSLARRLKARLLVDAAGMFDPEEAHRAGLRYAAIGRGFRVQ